MKSLLTILICGATLASAQVGGGPGHGDPTDPNAPFRAAITSNFNPTPAAPNELIAYSGIPCLYDVIGVDVFSASAAATPYVIGEVYRGGNGIGCVCLGACYNGMNLDAAFIQEFVCSYSVVEAAGASGALYTQDAAYNQGQPYPSGLIARGSAEVVNIFTGIVVLYQGYDISTCLGNTIPSDPYFYEC